MIWKNFVYKWLDFTDQVQQTKLTNSGYCYILQDVIKNVPLRTQTSDKANFHWWYSSETLAGQRLFTFVGKVVWLDKDKRHQARRELMLALVPEWNPNIINRGFYELLRQDDWGNNRLAYCKVYWMPEPTNDLDSPVIDFRFELLSETERIYWDQHIVQWHKAIHGWITLSTTLPETFGSYVWAIPITNNWDWIAPTKIQIVGKCTNPKIINTRNGNKYRINWETNNLVLDNRNLNNNPLETFIVTDNWVNIKEKRHSGADIFLEAWLNSIAVLTDDPTENPVITITYRDTFISA